MTYDQILMLDTVARFGSFKAASEFLHKSQPAISIAIKKLEEEYGIQLFSRDEYRPKLTKLGGAFLDKARESLEKFQELDTFARELCAGTEANISLCIDAICPLAKFEDVFKYFFDPLITTSLNLSINILEDLQRKLVTEEVDFAIGSYHTPSDQIETIKLFTTKMVPVISQEHYGKEGPQLEDLKNLPLIVVATLHKNDSNVIGAINGGKQWSTTDMFTKEQLICAGLGWGRLPCYQVERHLNEGTLRIIDNLNQIETYEVPIYLQKLKTKIMGPNTKRLWNYLIEKKRQK